ncbi:hypothetical protein NEIG_00926 [Nematocida sp. ERTm5]|nr:hypothetical protein NEIG_00926 [Nematocida sp. ERTm5]
MQKMRTCILISLCIFIYQVCGSSKKGDSNKDLEYLIQDGNKKEGVLISTYTGDLYIAIKDGKVIGVRDPRQANLFDIDLPTKETEPQEIKLEPWVEGKKYVIESNPVGEGLNVEIPIETEQEAKSNLMIIRNVIAKNAKKPVFEIVSASRQRCFSLDINTFEVSLQECSNGSNDLRTFMFLSMQEASKNEANKNGGTAFNMAEYTASTRVPAGTLIVGSKSGVLYLH